MKTKSSAKKAAKRKQTAAELNNITRIEIPKKIEDILIIPNKNSVIYSIIKDNEIVGFMSVPSKIGSYFLPSYAIWKKDVLYECFSTLNETLIGIKKLFAKKKGK